MKDERRELQEIPAAELTADRDKHCDGSETQTRFLLASLSFESLPFHCQF